MVHTYTFIGADGVTAHYADRKRAWWAMSVVYPLIPLLGLWAHHASGRQIARWACRC